MPSISPTLALVVTLIAATFLHAAEATPENKRVYELRTYTTPPGKLPELHARFRNHTQKLFEKHGMTNVIYWTPVDEPNKLVYLLSHASEAAGKASFAAFRADPVWQEVLAESQKNGSLTSKVESLYLQPTDYSAASTIAELMSEKPGWLYELRIYTAADGKLPALEERFRKHTTKLFAKHGMINLVYGVPTDETLRQNTLVYVLAHQDRAAADASWKAFAADPEWKKVAAESEADGALLIKSGVRRLWLEPTDYSPVK